MSLLRADLEVIAELVPDRATVLDVGCGDGTLLAWLEEHKTVSGRGIEINQALVNQAMQAGLSVIQGDVDQELPNYPDDAFDMVILSQSLQMLKAPHLALEHLMRIAPRAVVSVPNFAHWPSRFYLFFKGRMPVTSRLTYQWYDTPNIHFCTVADFVELCDRLGITIEKRIRVSRDGRRSAFRGAPLWVNVFAEQAVFLLRR